jgi:hypothetical protein
MFWDRRLGALVNDALALGFARKRGLDPFANMLHEAFQLGAPLSLGYLQLAGHINDLALQDWRPWAKPAIAKFNALAELHARALVSLEEVLLLSFSGYPAGAATVSRTLHEVRVIACFLGRFDANLSERFLESHIIDLWRSRTDFAPHGAKRRGREWRAFEAELEHRYQDVLRRHGKSMLIENGWAWPRFKGRYGFNQELPRRIGFGKLQEAAGQKYDVQRYRTASHRVHGSYLGGIQTLYSNEERVALLGPRPYRLAVPANESIGDVQDITDTWLRFCGRAVGDPAICYWREALDVLSYATRSLIIDAQSALDEAFKLDE